MNQPQLFRLAKCTVVDVTGTDAGKIVHNVTTNDVTALGPGQGCETFVTDVRGKTLAFVCVYRQNDDFRLIGPHGQSEVIAGHLDRYTIREDATPEVRDDEFTAVVLNCEAANMIECDFVGEASPGSVLQTSKLSHSILESAGAEISAYETRWLGPGTAVLLVPSHAADDVCQVLVGQSIESCDEVEFHRQRTLSGFPWFGIDLNDSNLPQEADRDALTISFTKGCYLGQETVARLDALGQVQKKLVRWRIEGAQPAVGTTLTANDKTVGRLTSVAKVSAGEVLAIGLARRSHFDLGSSASGIDDRTGDSFAAHVV